MMDEYAKCRFCKWYDNYEGCGSFTCCNNSNYKPSKQKIIEKSQDTGLSVADIIALIDMED